MITLRNRSTRTIPLVNSRIDDFSSSWEVHREHDIDVFTALPIYFFFGVPTSRLTWHSYFQHVPGEAM